MVTHPFDVAGGANFFTRSSNVGIAFESQILDVFTNTLERLNAMYPSEPKWMYGMGDALFDRLEIQSKDAFKYREVARYEISLKFHNKALFVWRCHGNGVFHFENENSTKFLHSDQEIDDFIASVKGYINLKNLLNLSQSPCGDLVPIYAECGLRVDL